MQAPPFQPMPPMDLDAFLALAFECRLGSCELQFEQGAPSRLDAIWPARPGSPSVERDTWTGADAERLFNSILQGFDMDRSACPKGGQQLARNSSLITQGERHFVARFAMARMDDDFDARLDLIPCDRDERPAMDPPPSRRVSAWARHERESLAEAVSTRRARAISIRRL